MGTVKLGHASISELGSIHGKPGDQTGKEVCIRDWYPSSGWDYVLRPVNAEIAEKAVEICKKLCNCGLVGYSQSQRQTLYNELKKHKFDVDKYIASKVATNADCSSFVGTCYTAAGVKGILQSGWIVSTSGMVGVYKKTKKFKALSGSKYTGSSKYLKPGDVLVSEGHHTAMVLGEGEFGSSEVYGAGEGDSSSTISSVDVDYIKAHYKEIKKRIEEYEKLKEEFYNLDVDEDKKIDEYITKFRAFNDEFVDITGEINVSAANVSAPSQSEINNLINNADSVALNGKNTVEKCWNFLYNKIDNAKGVAGLMGNLYAESGINPKNLEGKYEKKLGYTDSSYTKAVDSGKYKNFVKDEAGYGLAQWTYHTRKDGLLKYAKKKNKSIGDLQIQLEYLWKELNGYTDVLNTLKNAKSVKEASDAVLTKFERPSDMSDAVKVKRASYGKSYYKKYKNKK